MSEILRRLLARESRYRIADDRTLTVVVECAKTGSVESVEGKLVDISRGGAKLLVGRPVPLDEKIIVRIQIGEPEGTISVAAEGCWINPARENHWWLGCRFCPEIPADVLTELANDGYLNRRQHSRERVGQRLTARWELRSRRSVAWVLDLSAGGFCLLSQDPGEPGERVLLELQREDAPQVLVTARVRWQVSTDDGYVLGCEFLDKNGYAALREIDGIEKPTIPDRPAPGWLRSLWPWSATAGSADSPKSL